MNRDSVNIEPTLTRCVTLILTHKCNLRCNYCYQRHSRRDHAAMPLAMAKQILIKEFHAVPPNGLLMIVLMGGEVFTEWDLFRDLCEWVVNQQWPVAYKITGSTNGTLINSDIKRWLSLHREHISLGLSLDGDNAMQSINRGTSDGDIDISFFRSTWPMQGVKMTLSGDTIRGLSHGIIYLHRQWGLNTGYRRDVKADDNEIACNIAYGSILSRDNYFELKRELSFLIDFYTDSSNDYTPATILNYDFSYCPMDFPPEIVHKRCGAGTAMICYDTDGRTYPCQYFIPLTMSSDHLAMLPRYDFSEDTRDPSCMGCVIESICPTCYGNNYLATNDPFVRDKSLCIHYKLIALANCILQAKLILPQTKPSDRELYSLRVINTIYPMLRGETKAYETSLG